MAVGLVAAPASAGSVALTLHKNLIYGIRQHVPANIAAYDAKVEIPPPAAPVTTTVSD